MCAFVNPYNFVPLVRGKELKRASESSGDKRVTGKIEYTITTKTPLFIPNTSNDQYFAISKTPLKKSYHKSFDFFSYTDLSGKENDGKLYSPVIPGSEIRGAVRSVFEALTNSCMSAVEGDAVISKRTPETYTPGILMRENDKVVLYEATDYLLRDTDFSVKKYKDESLPRDGSWVLFEEERREKGKHLATLADDGEKGYLVKGSDGPQLSKPRSAKCRECPDATKRRCNEKDCYLIEKHCAHIFAIKRDKNENNLPPVTVDEKWDWEKQLARTLRFYRENKESVYSEYELSFKEFSECKDNGCGLPVYYSRLDKNHIYLSPACITREVYYNTINSLIGKHRTCTDEQCLCPACRLFGMVNTRAKDAWSKASSLRFSDVHLSPDMKLDGVYEEQEITLPELASPKVGATEMYLQMPEGIDGTIMSWTYDYVIYLDSNNKPKIKCFTPTISGRKFYWHGLTTYDEVVSPFSEKAKMNPEEFVTERNITIHPVKSNTKFKGTVYFDNITEHELEQIAFILNMSDGTNYGIKLGTAKPLGLGSVSLEIDKDKVYIRNVQKEERVAKYANDCWKSTEEQENLFADGSIFEILDMEALGQDDVLHYPTPKDSEDACGYEWFVKNRVAYKYNQKSGKVDVRDESSSPSKRTQIKYSKHLTPLSIRLNNVDSVHDRSTTVKNGGNSEDLIKGQQYNGVVKGHNPSGKFAKVRLENGVIASVYDGGKLSVGDHVVLVYKGVGDKGYPVWERKS